MTTATTSAISAEIVEERWRMATTTVWRSRGEAPSATNSEAMTSLMESLEHLAARMVEDGIYGESEGDAFGVLQNRLLSTIEAMIKDYALDVETARAARRNGAAA